VRVVPGIALCGMLLTGCVAKTAYNVVTLPVRAGGKVVDWTTTSQEEADRNRGREMRKQEKRDREAARKEEKRRERLAREGYDRS
jgi:hypothetical protein